MLRRVWRLHRRCWLRNDREVLDVAQRLARAAHAEETSVLRHLPQILLTFELLLVLLLLFVLIPARDVW